MPEELLKENEVMQLMMECPGVCWRAVISNPGHSLDDDAACRYVKSDHTSDFSVKGA